MPFSEIEMKHKRIAELIEKIYVLHNDFSTELSLRKDVEFLNLKKKQIRHVTDVVKETEESFSINNNFYRLLSNYSDSLQHLTVEIDLEYDFADLDLRSRVKQPDSIVNKLKYYRVGKVEEGKIDLIKCLNDLFGFRITLNHFDHNNKYFQELCETLTKQYNKRIVIRDSSKLDYKATHIYFYGESNKYFPWELQIWCSEHVISNDESHKVHKQAYTKWARIYKHSTEIS